MKMLLASLIILVCTSMTTNSIYDFKLPGIDGSEVDFANFKGKTLVIVNVASKCGYTPQYADLEKLKDLHGDKIEILGFPANNFASQEPGSNQEIAAFCESNYGVSFQMFEKISVTGDDQHPLYKWLAEKSGYTPTWNFCKYVVKPDGSVRFFPSKINPLDDAILEAI